MSTAQPEPTTGTAPAPGATPATTPVPTPPNAPTPPPGPTRPDGVSDTEWTALGDPGKAALVRERARATTAEQELATLRSKPIPTPPSNEPKPSPGPVSQADLAELIRESVAAAVAPIQQETVRQATERMRGTILSAATEKGLYDATDALAQLDLPSLTDGAGSADPAKVTAALDDLLARKPHLGRAVDPLRRPAPGSPLGSGGTPTSSLDDRVKAQLALMKQG